MKKIKSFKLFENESMDEQIYNQVFDSIKDCFKEFEDNDWQWSQGERQNHNHFSYHPVPYFKYIMKKKEDISYDPYDYRKFEFTGSIDSNGEILWETKKPTYYTNLSSEEFIDFVVAIKRIHDEIGFNLKFSYNNLGGDKIIIIQGKI